jgi:hypothetical protein
VQADHRVPAGLVGGGEVLDEARHGDAFLVGNVGAAGQHFGDAAGGRRIVVLVRPRQGHDQPARDFVRQALHVVDLRRQQQLADVGEHRFRHAMPSASCVAYTEAATPQA